MTFWYLRYFPEVQYKNRLNEKIIRSWGGWAPTRAPEEGLLTETGRAITDPPPTYDPYRRCWILYSLIILTLSLIGF